MIKKSDRITFWLSITSLVVSALILFSLIKFKMSLSNNSEIFISVLMLILATILTINGVLLYQKKSGYYSGLLRGNVFLHRLMGYKIKEKGNLFSLYIEGEDVKRVALGSIFYGIIFLIFGIIIFVR